jgi:hypothetical protein
MRYGSQEGALSKSKKPVQKSAGSGFYVLDSVGISQSLNTELYALWVIFIGRHGKWMFSHPKAEISRVIQANCLGWKQYPRVLLVVVHSYAFPKKSQVIV